MSVTSQPIRRTLTVALAVAALLLGVFAIRAAAAWTVQAAPLVASPASAQQIESKLAEGQARSDALQQQLEALTGQTEDMTAALTAAQTRIVGDSKHADDLTKSLTAANQKLKALQAAARASTYRASTYRASTYSAPRPATVRAAPTPTHHETEGGDHGDH